MCKRYPQLTHTPPEWDWLAKGAVASVKAQGGCGGCWAYAAAAAVEGAWFMAGHALESLSVQQLISCDHVGDDGGCGGSVTNLDTYAYVLQAGGLASDATYPVANSTLHDKPPKCEPAKAAQPAASISRAWRISGVGHLNDTYPGLNETFPGRSPWRIDQPGNRVNESRVLEALAKLGPLSITIKVGSSFASYKGGVDTAPKHISGCPYYRCFAPESCCPDGQRYNDYSTLDHEVLLVGWGEEAGVPYLVRSFPYLF